MKNLSLLLFLSLLLQKSYSYPLIPNEKTSPGHMCTINDTDFQEYRYRQNIVYCKRNLSFNKKTSIYNKYGIDLSERDQYTIDHIIPLSIGGSNSELNLWPEHKNVKQSRPNLETCIFNLVKNDLIKQKIAVDFILKVKFNKKVDGYDPPTLELVRACLKD